MTEIPMTKVVNVSLKKSFSSVNGFCKYLFGLIYSHVNRKTQFENPVQARRRQSHSSNMSYSTVPPPHEGPPSFQSAAALAKAQEAEAQSRSV